jgi:hypothetical protein
MRCGAGAERSFAANTPARARARAMSPTTRPAAEPPADPPGRGDRPARPAAEGRPGAPDEREQRAEARQTDAVMWGIVGHMAASLTVYGGLGYLLGRLTGHPILLLFGALFGLVLSIAYTIYSANRNASK